MIEPDDREAWADLLDALEEPPAPELVDRVADTYDVSKVHADEVVFEAIDGGPLVEDDEAGGAYGVVRLEDERDYTRDGDEPRPLERYEYSGHYRGDEDDPETVARDAAVVFTASNMGPPFATNVDDGGEWWQHGYDCACVAVEEAIADALLADREADDSDTDDTDESNREDRQSTGPNPTPNGSKTATRDGETDANSDTDDATDTVDREDAVAALRDVLEFYHARLDDEIADHTEAGEHPERPTTAREYFTEGRGWSDDTVDELLLGWAPVNHVDQLVAFLHDRGHSREAMLATGAIGERDSGSLYTTFSARYVLPYYDEDGKPEYAIARATAGDGGGAAGYAGHPDDGKAGKYAKLRHTDDRVPFDEPIYGVDTLTEGDHVVVAEGIADAITARERGYAVLSPVAKEFKEKHLDRFAEVVDDHGVGRVTIVADADGIYGDAAVEADPETVAEAAGVLSPTGAGLAGALRTASKLEDRTEADLRVVEPPAPADLENDLDDFVTGAWRGDLDALLRSAKPARAFDELEVVTRSTGSAEEAVEFDAEDHEPTATEADETTDDIHDIYHALDRLDAQRVAEDTIVSEWLEGPQDNRAFRPTWASSDYRGTAVFANSEVFKDVGSRGGKGGPAVMAAIDAGLVRDTQCPSAVEGETWVRAVDHLRDLGYSIPRLEASSGDDDTEEYRTDPRERTATVDARRAWKAAGRVTPDELEADLGLATTDDGEAWVAPSGERIGDVVRAVALDAGKIATADADPDNYPATYNEAREEYGAPLPRYYTTADAVARFDAVLDVIAETTFFDLNTDALDSEITNEDGEIAGDAVRTLNPSWRDSESGESVIVYDSGTVYDAATDRAVDTLRLVALEAGLIESPAEPVEGEDFTEAYRLARTEYGAPLPRWEPAEDGSREITPQLPAAEALVEEFDHGGVDGDALTEAREEVEALLRDVTADDGEPTVVTALPATGKTTGSVKVSGDRPLSYLPPRKELQEQALAKAEEWGVDARICPVFCDESVRGDVLEEAVAHVRANSKERLRERWAVLSDVYDGIGEEPPSDASELFTEGDDEDGDEVDLDRPTCETARGDHGVAWALAVHVARKLGYTPRQIHRDAEGLFGASLPCDAGEGCTCEYADGWDHVADPDDPADLVVGSYIHAHVESVRTHYERGPDGSVERTTRGLVLDEFPGEAFTREFEEEAVDHATWLARSLVDEVEDRRDMIEADLYGEEWVVEWLEGNGDEVVGDTVDALERIGALYDAREAAAEIRTEVDSELLSDLGLADPLEVVDVCDAYTELSDAIAGVDPNQPGAGVARWADEEVREPLERATAAGTAAPSIEDVATDSLPEEGDLRGLVDRATEAVAEGEDGARGVVEAAVVALRGGREGCRRLAAWAVDGYAHPDAHHLLKAQIIPSDEAGGEARRLYMDNWAFDEAATEGTTVKYVETGDKSTVLADRNDHGAILHTPPSRESGGGGEVPLVGLDATGRAELWATALGEDVTTADIHDTPRERAEFLESALSLRVIQAADKPRSYEGDPDSKDTDGDVALLQEIAEEYAGVEGPRAAAEGVDAVGKPAAITTKDVREVLEADSRLDDVVADWENYGNVTGANNLGEHRLAAILGSQHYGDDAIERFCALAGEEVDTERNGARGSALDYGTDLANTYLQHMREDQTMQAVLRFARGGSGATVVARTSALREDLPVVGDAQVVETWNDNATEISRAYRRLGGRFTVEDVADAVDLRPRSVRRILGELVEAGYLSRVVSGAGRAGVWEPAAADPGAGDADLPEREEAVASDQSGQSPHNEYYTWNVRLTGVNEGGIAGESAAEPSALGAPPSPDAVDGVEPPS